MTIQTDISDAEAMMTWLCWSAVLGVYVWLRERRIRKLYREVYREGNNTPRKGFMTVRAATITLAIVTYPVLAFFIVVLRLSSNSVGGVDIGLLILYAVVIGMSRSQLKQELHGCARRTYQNYVIKHVCEFDQRALKVIRRMQSGDPQALVEYRQHYAEPITSDLSYRDPDGVAEFLERHAKAPLSPFLKRIAYSDPRGV